jgi:phospholipid/cholesterol/gamma-HCH transport system ATP-binding protein
MSAIDDPQRPAPPPGVPDDYYQYHSYKVYPSGRRDVIEFKDTYKSFGQNQILRGLTMGLPEGMVSMILGPSGTGKSVCIKHMVGLLYPDSGDVLVHGESVPDMPDDRLFEMRKKFGLLFQDGALFSSMNLYDNVAFPLRQHTEKSEQEIEEIVMRRLREVGLGNARERFPNELSGGMRKRAGFARALVLGPDIVLFDEPDSGLDPVRTALLGELILEIHRDMVEEAKAEGKAYLPTFAVVTHDIMSARRVADYINVLWRGRIVEAGPAEDMLNSDNPFIRQFLAGESQGPLSMD